MAAQNTVERGKMTQSAPASGMNIVLFAVFIHRFHILTGIFAVVFPLKITFRIDVAISLLRSIHFAYSSEDKNTYEPPDVMVIILVDG